MKNLYSFLGSQRLMAGVGLLVAALAVHVVPVVVPSASGRPSAVVLDEIDRATFVIHTDFHLKSRTSSDPSMSLADLPFSENPDCGWCAPTTCWATGQPVAGHLAGSESDGSQDVGDGWHASTCFPGECQGNHPVTCACFCSEAPDPEECERDCENEHFGSSGEVQEGAGWRILLPRELPDVWIAVRSGLLDPRRVADMYANVEFNIGRVALQVMDCSDQVIAHMPLPMQYMTSVQEN